MLRMIFYIANSTKKYRINIIRKMCTSLWRWSRNRNMKWTDVEHDLNMYYRLVCLFFAFDGAYRRVQWGFYRKLFSHWKFGIIRWCLCSGYCPTTVFSFTMGVNFILKLIFIIESMRVLIRFYFDKND